MYEPGFCGAIKLSLRRTLVRQSIIQLLRVQQRLFFAIPKSRACRQKNKTTGCYKKFSFKLISRSSVSCNQFFLFHVTQLLLLMLVVVLMPAAYFLICYL